VANSYLPAFGRFLIVVTFLEDALRIVTQFGDQIYYLMTYRPLMIWGIAHLFLILNVLVSFLLFKFVLTVSGHVVRELYGHRSQTF